MASYNTIPTDETPVAPKKSFKGLVACAALVSFALGALAATATPKPMEPAVIQTEHKQQLSAKGHKKSSGGEYWWQDGSSSFRTVSPVQEGLGLSDLKGMVDSLHAGGVKALLLNAAYDSGAESGYDPDLLWNGLAINDHLAVSPSIGSVKDFKDLVAYAHKKGMKLGTWFNPSYVWTGSEYFKTAEKDMTKYCASASDKYSCALNDTPSGSPARWFYWGDYGWGAASGMDPPATKPADDKAPWQAQNYVDADGADLPGAWIDDADAGASYLSHFGYQPDTSFKSPEWQAQLKAFFKFWIVEMGVDGFVLDYPDGYVGAGEDWSGADRSTGDWVVPPLDYDGGKTMQSAITQVVRDIGKGKVFVFGETYEDPEVTAAYGLDGGLGHQDPGRQMDLAKAVAAGKAKDIEGVFTGTGGADHYIATCYFTEFCTVAWMRPDVWASGLRDADAGTAYNCYPSRGADGYAPDSIGSMPLSSCFGKCHADSKCLAITYEWDSGDCYPRGKVDPDKCDKVDGLQTRGQLGQGFTTFSTFDAHAPDLARLSLALSAGGGYLTGVENSGPGLWWSKEPWPGSGDAETKDLFQALGRSNAFKTRALRMQLKTNADSSAYAMLKYDPVYTGDVAIAVYNLDDKPATIAVSKLPYAVLGQRPTDLVSGKSLSKLSENYKVSVPARGYVFLGGLKLPEFASEGHLECHNTGYDPDASGDMSLAQCMATCSGDSKCRGVTVEWLDAGTVRCYKRGSINAKKCDADGGFTTFSRAD